MHDLVTAHGQVLVPHITAHLTPEIASMQSRAGASAFCCQTVSEALAMSQNGVDDIIITQPVWGQFKWRLLAELLSECLRVTVVCSNHEHAKKLSELAAASGYTLSVLLRLPSGLHEGGSFDDVNLIDLANTIAGSSNLDFRGLALPKLISTRLVQKRDRLIIVQFYHELVRYIHAELMRADLEPGDVICGETAGMDAYLEVGLGTVLTFGTYALMDSSLEQMQGDDHCPAAQFEQSLMILSTVHEEYNESRFSLDGSRRAMDHDMTSPTIPMGEDTQLQPRQDDFGGMSVDREQLELGDRLLIVPSRASQTVFLHDWFVGMRGFESPRPSVESIWPIALRSCLR